MSRQGFLTCLRQMPSGHHPLRWWPFPLQVSKKAREFKCCSQFGVDGILHQEAVGRILLKAHQELQVQQPLGLT